MSVRLAKLALNPEHQNLEHVQRIVSSIIGRAGCLQCGRLLRLELEFQGDPPSDLNKLPGVISVETQGF
jgi:hypothetical protein